MAKPPLSKLQTEFPHASLRDTTSLDMQRSFAIQLIRVNPQRQRRNSFRGSCTSRRIQHPTATRWCCLPPTRPWPLYGGGCGASYPSSCSLWAEGNGIRRSCLKHRQEVFCWPPVRSGRGWTSRGTVSPCWLSPGCPSPARMPAGRRSGNGTIPCVNSCERSSSPRCRLSCARALAGPSARGQTPASLPSWMSGRRRAAATTGPCGRPCRRCRSPTA